MKMPLLLLLVSLLLPGCANYQPLQIEPVKRTAPISPRFSNSYYYFDRDHNLNFIMRAETTDQLTHKPISQVATIRVFWHPRGGVTTLNPAALNATFRYLVMTPDAVGMYEGAGFVRLNSKDGDSRFAARVMDGDMRLTQASATFTDTLGRAHLRGYFKATYNDAAANDMLLAAQREFFGRSLSSRPPATEPAAESGPATLPATAP